MFFLFCIKVLNQLELGTNISFLLFPVNETDKADYKRN